MSTSYRATTPQEFFDMRCEKGKGSSLMDQLSEGLKSSLKGVWEFMGRIDMKRGLDGVGRVVKQRMGSAGSNSDNVAAVSVEQLSSLDSLQSQQQPLTKTSPPSKHPSSPIPSQSPPHSKKQQLQQKKDFKRVISFDEFAQQQERRLNESFIRRNVENRRELNRSMVSQQQQQEKNGQEGGQRENGDNNNRSSISINSKNNLVGEKQHPQHDHHQTHIQGPPLHSHHHHHPHINDSILNISDIDSECNFNILNNNGEEGEEYKQRRRGGRHDEREQEHEEEEDNKEGEQRLVLAEYPFVVPGKRVERNGKTNNSSSNNRSNNNVYMSSSSTTRPTTTTKPTPTHAITPSSLNIDQQPSPNNYIDVDLPSYQPKRPQPSNQQSAIIPTPLRKQVKLTYEHIEQIAAGTGDNKDKRTQERYARFERLLEARYERMVEEALVGGQKGGEEKQQTMSLKEEYERYVNKNFGAMQHIKRRLQQNNCKLINPTSIPSSTTDPTTSQPSSSPPPLPTKLPLLPTPLPATLTIPRKKLYNFTRQCQSKICVSQQLTRSVKEDKHRQVVEREDMRRRQEEEELRRKREQEEQRRRQEEMLRRQQEDRERRVEEERLRRENEEKERVVRESQQMDNSGRDDNDQKEQVKEFSYAQQQPQVLNASIDAIKKSTSEDNKPQEGSNKTNSLFGSITPGSLFETTVTPKSPTADKEAGKPKQDVNIETRQEGESSVLNKTASVIEPTKQASQVQKKPQKITVPKSPQNPSPQTSNPTPTPTQQKKEHPKFNPFLASVSKPTQMTKLQQIINSKKDDNSLFKTVITPSATPIPGTSPQRQPNQSANPATFLSPARNLNNTSQYTNNLDSSMCEESESNITPAGNSQQVGNGGLGGLGGVNGSFLLNNSFSSQPQQQQQQQQQQPTNTLFTPSNSTSLFNGPTTNSLFGSAYNNPMNPTPSSGLFTPTPSTMFNPVSQAVNKIPSFMQGHPTISPAINPQSAMNLFNQRSPSKNESQSLFGAPAPVLDNKRQSGNASRRDKKAREERIR